MILLPTPKMIDTDNPEHLDFLHRKILYALDDRPIYWWKKGTKYGVVNGEAKAMWNMWVFFVQRILDHQSDRFDVISLEAVYLTEPDTGEVLENWYNFYTDQTLSVPGQLMGPETQTFLSDGSSIASSPLPGLDIKRKHTLGPATVVGDDLWFSFDSSAIVTRSRDGEEKKFRINDLETFNAQLSDVLDPDVLSAPASATLHLISSWQGWLGMEGYPGSQVTRLVARKAFQFDDIPVELQHIMRRHHPDIASDPVSALDRSPESFED
jgi:hypothetical protein